MLTSAATSRVAYATGVILLATLISIRPALGLWILGGAIAGVFLRVIFTRYPWIWTWTSALLAAIALVGLLVLIVMATDVNWALGLLVGTGVVLSCIVLLWRSAKARSLLPKALGILAILFVTVSPFFMVLYSPRSGRPTVTYSGQGQLEAGNLDITHELEFMMQDMDDSAGRPDPLRRASPSLEQMLLACGWVERAPGLFRRETHQRISVRWFPLTTAARISFPNMSCVPSLRASRESKLSIYFPKYVVKNVFPHPDQRDEEVVGDRERIVVPVVFAGDEPPSVQIELMSVLVRNRAGMAVLDGAAWEPLKWILLALCAIFGEQIKTSVLIPSVRGLFRVLHIRYRDDSKTAEPEPKRRIILPGE